MLTTNTCGCFAIFLLLQSLTTYGQAHILPDTTTLFSSVDRFYKEQAQVQVLELRQTKRYRWLAYLPSPGYFPFGRGFALSFNLLGPLQEIRTAHSVKLKTQSIYRTANIQAQILKYDVWVDRQKIEHAIQEYEAIKTLDSLHALSFMLSSRQYENNELLPSQFLTIQQAHEERRLSRLKTSNSISEAISALNAKAKVRLVEAGLRVDGLKETEP